ncbi:MAG: MGMT family protein [Candidatus Pacebacteria bacterium]|nr:MGMT family protein [Candidatus Paceibacterota bacterium]
MKATNFAERVRDAVRQIPKGETRTYGQVAAAIGHAGAARAVGTIMRDNYDPTVPCHRVIRSDGKIGEYNRGGPEKKRALLRSEGVSV